MTDSELIPAATVVLLRDGDNGLEVLMLKRNSKIAFGGMWVFPGGRVDQGDLVEGDDQESARLAAVREAMEEAGVEVEADKMVAWAYWVPPKSIDSYVKAAKRRYSTWFFVAEAPVGEVRVDMGEIHDYEWMSPAAALGKRDDGVYELAPPTWVTLYQLAQQQSVASALAYGNSMEEVPQFHTRPVKNEFMTLLWAGDHEYPDGKPAPEGAQHRLLLDPEGWVYRCDH